MRIPNRIAATAVLLADAPMTAAPRSPGVGGSARLGLLRCFWRRPSVLALRPPALAASAYPAWRLASRARRRGPAGHARQAQIRAARRARRTRRKKARKPALHGDPARARLAFEAMQKYYYIAGSGLYAGNRSRPVAVLAGARRDGQHVQHPRHDGLVRTREVHDARWSACAPTWTRSNSGAPEGTFTSTLAAFDGTVAPPAGPGRAEVLRRQRLGRDRAGAPLQADAQRRPLLGSAEGIMAFEMAGWQANPELACPGGIPFSNSAENTERNTVTNAPAAELASAALPDHRQCPVSAVRRDGLRMGAPLPAAAERPLRRPHPPAAASSNRRCGATTRER